MKQASKKHKIRPLTVISAVIAVGTVALALYIMTHQMGLSSSLDFGAGAYYYIE